MGNYFVQITRYLKITDHKSTRLPPPNKISTKAVRATMVRHPTQNPQQYSSRDGSAIFKRS